MQFRALQLAYFNGALVEPGGIVESDVDISADLAPANPATPSLLSPIYERVEQP